MGSKVTFKMDDGWKRMARALDPDRFNAALQKHVGQATLRNAQLLQRRVRKRIQTSVFKRNAALTKMIKRDDKPMVGKGDLFQAVTHVQESWNRAFVGVLRTSGDFNVARIVHEGATINVTDKMRAMFMLLWLVSEGRESSAVLTGRARDLWEQAPGGWFPLKESTRKIVIPSRPFLDSTFRLKSVRDATKGNWERAVQRAIREVSK